MVPPVDIIDDDYDDGDVIVIMMKIMTVSNDDDLHLRLGQRCPQWTGVGRRCQGDPMD